MRRKFLASLAALAAGGGLALGQTPPPRLPALTTSDTPGAVTPASALTAQPGPGGLSLGPDAGSAVAGPPPAGPGGPGGVPGYPPPGYPDPNAGGFPGGYPAYPGAGYPGNPNGPNPYLQASPLDAHYGAGGAGGAGGDPGASPLASRVFGNVEYLFWFMRPAPIGAPLVTMGSPLSAGITNALTTRVVAGDEDLNYYQTSGIRVTTGYWIDGNRRYGVELGGFLMEQRSHVLNFESDSNGIPVIARPFIEANTGQPTAILVSYPGFLSGGVNVTQQNRTYGADLNGLVNIYRSPPGRRKACSFDLIGGFRWLEVDERLSITQISTLLPGNTTPFAGLLVTAPAQIGVNDSFGTKNSFYGGNVGGRLEIQKGRWTMTATCKIGIGDTHEILDINGASALTKTGFTAQAIQQGGLLAAISNVDHSDKDVFSVLPEGSIQFGYQLSPAINLFCGYNMIYLSKMVRPGDQLDPVVNGTQIPTSSLFGVPFGPDRPASGTFNQNYFWAQGVTWGINIRF
jgi:hypothetical protein